MHLFDRKRFGLQEPHPFRRIAALHALILLGIVRRKILEYAFVHTMLRNNELDGLLPGVFMRMLDGHIVPAPHKTANEIVIDPAVIRCEFDFRQRLP